MCNAVNVFVHVVNTFVYVAAGYVLELGLSIQVYVGIMCWDTTKNGPLPRIGRGGPWVRRYYSLRPQVETTVYVQDVAGHIIACLDDIADSLGDLFGLGKASERNLAENTLLNILG